MARNTPYPQRVVSATTAALANDAGTEGEIIFDKNKKTLVGMDGATPGGNPLALEARKIKSGTEGLKINGGTEADLSADITLTAELGEGVIWGKRVAGAKPEDDASIQAIISDMPVGSYIYFEE